MHAQSVEVEVREVRLCSPVPGQGVALVGPRRGPGGRILSLTIGAGEAHALRHELRGQETIRSQALGLAQRVAEVLGGRLVAVHLSACGPGLVRSALVLETTQGLVEVPIEPGQALGAAVRFGLPLSADRALFEITETHEAGLSGPLAAFLDSLDLTGLDT